MVRLLSTACLLTALLPFTAGAEISPSPTPPAVPAVAATPVATAPPATAAPKITYSSCHVDGPYIAMTFDDGPHVQNTPRLLDMLKERNIKATFFMVGENAARYPQIVKRIIAEGHVIGNHSWTHPQLSKMTDAGVRDELQKTQDAIIAGCGIVPKLMRPPYGAFTQRQQRWCYGEFGYKIILWDVDPEDWKYRNAAHVESEILKQTVAGSIILSHDIHKTTVDAMPTTLDKLLAKGFKFVTVPELIAMDHPAAKKGAKPASAEAAPAPAAKPTASGKTEAAPPHSATTSAAETPKPDPAAPAPAAATPAAK
jgi:peptidoglycan-N-acetylglucosamine deacetylase